MNQPHHEVRLVAVLELRSAAVDVQMLTLVAALITQETLFHILYIYTIYISDFQIVNMNI